MNERNNKVFITFHGGARSVTGSNFLIEFGEKKILIDCGFFQGSRIGAKKNREKFPYDTKEIDVLFVTHAHIDHIGRIPQLMQEGFSGKIYSTPPTKDIARLLLEDSMRVLAREAREEGTDPMYTIEDVNRAMSMWGTVGYRKKIDLGDGIEVLFKDAGHILGSSMVEFTYSKKKIVFTGDLGNSPAPLLHDTESIKGTDYLVMESVYGDRNHEDLEERAQILRSIIEQTIEKKGVLMIPAFSVERTQDLLYEINEMVEKEGLLAVPIFLDSPLAIKVTKVYKKYDHYFNDNARKKILSGDDIFRFPKLKFTENSKESREIKSVAGPKIILAGSGMSNGGRIVRHEADYLPDPNNILLLVGYQAPNTRGRQLADGVKEIEIDGEMIPVRAQILQVHGYSAHKEGDALFDFVEDAHESLKKVFVVLGEPKASLFLAQRIKDYLNLDVEVPAEGDKVEIVL